MATSDGWDRVHCNWMKRRHLVLSIATPAILAYFKSKLPESLTPFFSYQHVKAALKKAVDEGQLRQSVYTGIYDRYQHSSTWELNDIIQLMNICLGVPHQVAVWINSITNHYERWQQREIITSERYIKEWHTVASAILNVEPGDKLQRQREIQTLFNQVDDPLDKQEKKEKFEREHKHNHSHIRDEYPMYTSILPMHLEPVTPHPGAPGDNVDTGIRAFVEMPHRPRCHHTDNLRSTNPRGKCFRVIHNSGLNSYQPGRMRLWLHLQMLGYGSTVVAELNSAEADIVNRRKVQVGEVIIDLDGEFDPVEPRETPPGFEPFKLYVTSVSGLGSIHDPMQEEMWMHPSPVEYHTLRDCGKAEVNTWVNLRNVTLTSEREETGIYLYPMRIRVTDPSCPTGMLVYFLQSVVKWIRKLSEEEVSRMRLELTYALIKQESDGSLCVYVTPDTHVFHHNIPPTD